jgi:hypothetical protein
LDNLDSHVDEISERLKNNFKYKINKKGERKVTFTQNVSYSQIADEIAEIYMKRFEKLISIEKITLFFLPSSFIFIILSAIFYLKRYLSSDSYKNYVLSAKFYELNENRQKKGKSSVLPLKSYLKYKYVDLYAIKISSIELKKMYNSFCFLFLTLLPVFIVLAIDYGLIKTTEYTYNNSYYNYTDNQDFPTEKTIVQVEGGGFMHNSIYKPLLEQDQKDLEEEVEEEKIITNFECLPETYKESEHAYSMIKNYLILIGFLTIFQAYFKRWMSVCAGSCYPERDEERAFWLFNHILSAQSLMSNFDSKSKSFSLKTILFHFIYFIANCLFQIIMCLGCCCYCFCLLDMISLKKFFIRHQNILIKLFKQQDRCHNCAVEIKDLDDTEKIKCSDKDCIGLYCFDCFNVLRNTCKYCKTNLIYDGIVSDLEIDSSDDENDYNSNQSLDFKFKSLKKSSFVNINKEQMMKIIDCYLKSFYELDLKKIDFSFLKEYEQNFTNEIDLVELLEFVVGNLIKNIQFNEYLNEKDYKNIVQSDVVTAIN